MIVEIAAGIAFGSMALLADGLHMGSHTAALSITAIAYVYTRRHASDSRFCFGTGKVNALGAFASAILLALFALLMAWESIDRFFNPVDILFNQAILVAVLGLLVNGAIVLLVTGIQTSAAEVSPTPNGITLPEGYKDWHVIATSHRTDNNTLRVILGNDVAI